MRIQISACTDKSFSEVLLPMAHLTDSEAHAVNDNARQQSKWKIRLHMKRVAAAAGYSVR